jgi:hypothetical protein
VQSIRAFRVTTCRSGARLGQHFLYANLAHAQTKQDVLELIATQFTFRRISARTSTRCTTA